jgi:hypothetical protein
VILGFAYVMVFVGICHVNIGCGSSSFFYGSLIPKGPRVFLLKIASKQPLLKASQLVQN